MRKEYGKAVRNLFAAGMKKRCSRFVETKVKSMYFTPGDRAFLWDAADLYRWVVLSPSPKGYDEFTVLIGWSRLNRYPELGMVPCADMPTQDRKEFALDEYMTRLPFLWTQKDEWWVVRKFRPMATIEEMQASLDTIPAATAKKTAEPQVEDAMDKLIKFGIPYLEELNRI